MVFDNEHINLAIIKYLDKDDIQSIRTVNTNFNNIYKKYYDIIMKNLILNKYDCKIWYYDNMISFGNNNNIVSVKNSYNTYEYILHYFNSFNF